ncbi:hypothetical protein OG552_31245 [Streptomyces sp. NBC_01476]|uniref:hypothetical protein n=1 Tax=Streptomyces sp. NBC_01476 TaxID=2903881 RepID=UPI002E34F024|nr:hypothetical protein [Streptomyces sp. NBC_01476]
MCLSGDVGSALAEEREVRSVGWRGWRDGRVLDLALGPCTDEELRSEAYTVGYDAMVEREDWLSVGPGGITRGELDGPMRFNARRTADRAARRGVRRLCAQAGAVWQAP